MGACERCGGAFAPAELELDVAGKFCCRRCRAHVDVALANRTLTEQGVRRRCRECQQATMLPESEVKNHDHPPGWHWEQDSDGNWVYANHGEPVTLGYRYRCSTCRATCYLFRVEYLFGLVVVWAISLLAMFMLSRDTAHLRGYALSLLLPLGLALVDGYKRYRNPAA
jgi:hypothetical protein